MANEVSKAQKLKKLKEEQQQKAGAGPTATAATNAGMKICYLKWHEREQMLEINALKTSIVHS